MYSDSNTAAGDYLIEVGHSATLGVWQARAFDVTTCTGSNVLSR